MRVVYFAALAWAMSAPFAIAAKCPADGETGFYVGVGKSTDVSVEASLNLYCVDGHISAQLFTSMGDFTVKDAASDARHVTVSFDSGASLGTLDLARNGSSLAGTFSLADETGTISLVRKYDAFAPDALNPRLNLNASKWHEDLSFLAQELPRRHAKPCILRHTDRSRPSKEFGSIWLSKTAQK